MKLRHVILKNISGSKHVFLHQEILVQFYENNKQVDKYASV